MNDIERKSDQEPTFFSPIPDSLFGRDVYLREARVMMEVIETVKKNPQTTWEQISMTEAAQRVPFEFLRYAYLSGLRQTLQE